MCTYRKKFNKKFLLMLTALKMANRFPCVDGLLQSADVAVLVTLSTLDLCGVAYEQGGMMTKPLIIVKDTPSCMEQWTLDHEIGHLLGAGHDPETEHREPKKYAYGKVLQPAEGEGTGYATIMVSSR
jgi:hypothetical protein